MSQTFHVTYIRYLYLLLTEKQVQLRQEVLELFREANLKIIWKRQIFPNSCTFFGHIFSKRALKLTRTKLIGQDIPDSQ